jgi:hypothetical protein
MYKQKYLKYKKKYLELKYGGGSKEYFKIETIEKNTHLYHATYNKLTGFVYNPGYYSKDPLQSLGHVLSTATKWDNMKIKNEILIKDLDKITCYPYMYVFKNKNDLKLLRMEVGKSEESYNNTFKIIFNQEKIIEYINRNTNKDNIKSQFIEKIRGIGKLKDNKEQDFETILGNYINIWCQEQCFGGWANTPGYYILSKIDYNAYLKEILPDIVTEDIDGIYVARDQDEIILFNNDKLDTNYNIKYILPYTYINKSTDDIKKFILEFIEKYNKIPRNVKDLNGSSELTDFKNIYIEFNKINNETKWNFDWFQSFCKEYDPYDNPKCIDELPVPTPTDCTEKAMIKSYPLNPDYLGLIDWDMDQYNCGYNNFYSSKVSILDICKHKDILLKWIKAITTDDKFDETNIRLFNEICKNGPVMLNRILYRKN